MSNISHYVGKAGEYRVLCELLLRGFNPSIMSIDNGVDIILNNGKTIQVKTSSKPDSVGAYRVCLATSKYKHGLKTNIKSKIKADFIIVWIAYTDDFYIIPSFEVKENLTICFSNKSKWKQYLKRWEILS